MLAGIKVPTQETTNRSMSDSERLEWLRGQAARIRQDYEAGRISETEAVRQLNNLLVDQRGLIQKFLDFLAE
ncbi:hypothetical protein CQ062_13660 [Ochrobactrum sp. MYb68]|nr:hypothetical protein CQ062_13660 [Ochrobactrum sp. MYb68]